MYNLIISSWKKSIKWMKIIYKKKYQPRFKMCSVLQNLYKKIKKYRLIKDNAKREKEIKNKR